MFLLVRVWILFWPGFQPIVSLLLTWVVMSSMISSQKNDHQPVKINTDKVWKVYRPVIWKPVKITSWKHLTSCSEWYGLIRKSSEIPKYRFFNTTASFSPWLILVAKVQPEENSNNRPTFSAHRSMSHFVAWVWSEEEGIRTIVRYFRDSKISHSKCKLLWCTSSREIPPDQQI